nr:DUF1217 domain-containing protein [Parvularcula dongshanensis]
MPTLTAYNVFQRSLQTTAAPEAAADPAVQAEIDYWSASVGKVRSVAEFAADARLVAFATKAFGYKEDAPSAALLGIALDQGAKDAGAYANRVPDYRLEELVRSFGFAEFGTARLRDPVFTEGIAKRYIAQSAEAPVASVPSTPAEVERQYFKTKIGTIETPDDLLADNRLYAYAMKAFGLEDRMNERFLIREVLADGVGEADDLANRLGDEKLQAFARSFGFGEVGTKYVQSAQFGETVARRYDRATGLNAQPAAEGEREETAYFREAIGKVRSLDDLFADKKLYDYVMTAFDLAGDTGKTALVRKVLEEGVSERDTFANRMSDPRYGAMARTIAFAEFGTRNLEDPGIVGEIVSRYERAQREIEAGQDDPAVELAAYFDRKASGLTSWYHVLSDTRLRNVTLTALGMPAAMGTLGVDRLAAEFQDRFDIADFQDEAKRADFIKTYLVLSDTGGSAGASSPILSLFSGGDATGLYGLVAKL